MDVMMVIVMIQGMMKMRDTMVVMKVLQKQEGIDELEQMVTQLVKEEDTEAVIIGNVVTKAYFSNGRVLCAY